MTEYHKINAPFKRDEKGKMLHGEWCMPELEYLSRLEWEFTEKVDGTNIRLYFENNKNGTAAFDIAGRTDNAQIPKPLMERLMELCQYVNKSVAAVMDERDIKELTVYGEGYGPRINGGGKYADTAEFVAFDIKVGDFWLLRKDVDDFCAKVGLESVPVLGRSTLHEGFELVRTGCMLSMSGGKIAHISSKFTGLRSMWGPFEAEGVIAVPAVPLFDRAGRRIITKIKARDFK
jgi:hypothetical protein